MSFSVEVRQDETYTVITISGALTHRTSPQLRHVLQQQCRQQPRHLRVDLAGQRMDASGAATLLEGVEWARRTGNRFDLVHLCRETRDILGLYRLDDVFDIADAHEDREEAA